MLNSGFNVTVWRGERRKIKAVKEMDHERERWMMIMMDSSEYIVLPANFAGEIGAGVVRVL